MTAQILQLSDLHLMSDPIATLKGIHTQESLNKILQFIRERIQARDWDFDYIFLTGDLAHDEKIETYETLRKMLGEWVSRCLLIPGNHDDRALIRKVFPELVMASDEFINFSVVTAGWRLIGLDSHVDGETYGQIGKTQLKWLDSELSIHIAQPTILFIHHPPVPVHSAWLDRIGLRDSDALFEVVNSNSQVRAISTGHVHQEFSEVLKGLRILTTPSTGVQFCPQQDELICDPIPPGFRIFRFTDDNYESNVIRLPGLIP